MTPYVGPNGRLYKKRTYWKHFSLIAISVSRRRQCSACADCFNVRFARGRTVLLGCSRELQQFLASVLHGDDYGLDLRRLPLK